MTISWYVQQQFNAAATLQGDTMVRLPINCVAYGSSMTGSQDWAATLDASTAMVGIKPKATNAANTAKKTRSRIRANTWSEEEHGRFLLGLELFPQGPWKEIAAVVGTRSTRQTMTHAQKHRHKINRRLKWATFLQSMVINGHLDGVPVTACAARVPIAIEEEEKTIGQASPQRVDSPLDVSCETFDRAIEDADLQILLENLAPPKAPTNSPLHALENLEVLEEGLSMNFDF
jgi:hypothetical protein